MATNNEDYDYICECDPAVDRDAEGYREKRQRYEETNDASHLPLVAGKEPIIYTLSHLRGRQKPKVRDTASKEGPMTAAYDACQLVLRNAIGPEAPEIKHERRGGFDVVTDDCLDAVGEAVVLELGFTAINRMSFS